MEFALPSGWNSALARVTLYNLKSGGVTDVEVSYGLATGVGGTLTNPATLKTFEGATFGQLVLNPFLVSSSSEVVRVRMVNIFAPSGTGSMWTQIAINLERIT